MPNVSVNFIIKRMDKKEELRLQSESTLQYRLNMRNTEYLGLNYVPTLCYLVRP